VKEPGHRHDLLVRQQENENGRTLANRADKENVNFREFEFYRQCAIFVISNGGIFT